MAPCGKNPDDVSRTDSPVADGSPVEAASFIAETVADLALLARRHRLHMLAHLLNMARLEADDFVRKQARSGRF
jgi:hypothetical protein